MKPSVRGLPGIRVGCTGLNNMYYYDRHSIEGQAEFYLLPVDVLDWFYVRTFGRGGFVPSPRRFSTLPPWPSKGCSLIKNQCRKHGTKN